MLRRQNSLYFGCVIGQTSFVELTLVVSYSCIFTVLHIALK